MKEKLKKVIQFILNPRLLFCVGLAWIITNGWSYIMLGVGMYFNIGWMIAVATAYLTFLWLPVSPEKIITFAIAIFLLRLLFPNDEKTLGVLIRMKEKVFSQEKKKKTDETTNNNEETAN